MSTTTTLNVPTGPKKKGKVKREKGAKISSGINAEYGIAELEYQLSHPHMATLPELEAKYKITNFPLLLNSGIVLTGVLFFFFGHSLFHVELGLAWIAMIGAMLLVLLSGIHNFDHVLEKVEFGTLMFFASLFILMETIAELGLIDWIAVQIEGLIALVPEGKARLFLATFLLLWVSGIASALIEFVHFPDGDGDGDGHGDGYGDGNGDGDGDDDGDGLLEKISLLVNGCFLVIYRTQQHSPL
eukprot:TRINITY_DN3647_c0_g3_i4.p1 TRINITY_DN3647_c0_g3~~TRINITY_DN3647_c0_g3_i4.p1  ORF type:complete len:243 (+),score=81.22 TRINITY_DN3647_c0_g3_i4:42-770(+)